MSVDRTALVAVFVSVRVEPATDAPVGSLTLPVSSPSVCAASGVTKRINATHVDANVPDLGTICLPPELAEFEREYIDCQRLVQWRVVANLDYCSRPALPNPKVLAIHCRANSTGMTEDLRKVLLGLKRPDGNTRLDSVDIRVLNLRGVPLVLAMHSPIVVQKAES